VFFTHQNPVAWDVGPDLTPLPGATTDDPGVLLPPTATDDVLLHADLVRLLVEAAYDGDAGPTLVGSPVALAERLRTRRPDFFDPDGNRRGGRGEFVVALRPQIDDAGGGAEVLSSAVLEVWTREPGGPPDSRPTWKLIKRLVTDHARRPDTAP
ncbi:MAG TPA: hypothetical protein VGF55_08595, partial [Gemmataceae bacterium]